MLDYVIIINKIAHHNLQNIKVLIFSIVKHTKQNCSY